MSLFEFARRARCGLLVLGMVLLPACAKQAPVEPPPPAPPPPQPKPKPSKPLVSADQIGRLLGGRAPTEAEAKLLKGQHEPKLVGTWTADLGDGYTEERTYNPDGTYSAKLIGPTPATASGKYAVVQSVGTKGLKLRLGDDPGAKTITVSFEGDELEHPSLRPGVTGTFRKK